MERYGHDMEKIRDEIDWDYFEDGSTERDVFGFGMEALASNMSNMSMDQGGARESA